jgi:hypothetical protein
MHLAPCQPVLSLLFGMVLSIISGDLRLQDTSGCAPAPVSTAPYTGHRSRLRKMPESYMLPLSWYDSTLVFLPAFLLWPRI